MIQANELRIGNFVKDSQFNILVPVSVSVLEEVDNGMNFYEPIPITQELLINFGFKQQNDSGLFIRGGFDVELLDGAVEFYLPDYGDLYAFIEYVHQLQNLYFALTGKELKLNDK